MRRWSPWEFRWTGKSQRWAYNICLALTNHTSLTAPPWFEHRHFYYHDFLSMCYHLTRSPSLWRVSLTDIWTWRYWNLFYNRRAPQWYMYQRLWSPSLFCFPFCWCPALCHTLNPRLTTCSIQCSWWCSLAKYLVDWILGEGCMDSPDPPAIAHRPLGGMHHWFFVQAAIPFWQPCWLVILEEGHQGIVATYFVGKMLKYH